MNYEQKYKEALERARQFSERPLEEDSSSIVEYIFPELESERIRKWLIDWAKAVNWSEQFTVTKEQVLAWLEKQGEQKTADKVEPKFKVGDWISGYYTNCKVTAINSKGYVVEDTDGNKINILFENEKFHHLFTIADAKNGDVLVVPHIEGSEHSEQIFIFKEIKDREYAKNAVEYYCRYLDGEFRTNERGFMGQADDYFTPATKEQRDILFAKMEEAGYEWDADKKKLNKIEEGKASFANRQLYNRAILAILSNYVEKYPDIRFGQMLCNLGIGPVFNEESQEIYLKLNETINKRK